MKVIALVLSIVLAVVYMLIAKAIDKHSPLKMGLDRIIPPVYFFLFLTAMFLYLSPYASISITMQLIFAVVAIIATVKFCSWVGNVAKNDFEKKAKKIMHTLYAPVRAIVALWRSIAFALKQIWNALINFFIDLVYTPLDAFINAYNTLSAAVVDIINALMEAFRSFLGIFKNIGKILKSIISMGGSIPESKLPPLPPLPK